MVQRVMNMVEKTMERRLGRCFSLSIFNFDILFSKLYFLSFIFN